MKYKHYINRQIQDGVNIPVPETYKDCVQILRTDYYRSTGRVVSFSQMFVKTLYNSSWAFIFYLRLASYSKGFLHLPFSAIRHILGRHLCITINPITPIGYGLCLGDGGIGIIINPNTVIGNNCTISQFVNIGTNVSNAAVLGNNTYIAPMCCLVDDVHIGDNVTIGAGAVVVKDIPTNATAVGVPARPINFDHPARYIGHRCEDLLNG